MIECRRSKVTPEMAESLIKTVASRSSSNLKRVDFSQNDVSFSFDPFICLRA